jgi:hypothetical protein
VRVAGLGCAECEGARTDGEGTSASRGWPVSARTDELETRGRRETRWGVSPETRALGMPRLALLVFQQNGRGETS